MTIWLIISGSRPTPFLMGQVWFNCNRVFSGFEFIFSNPRLVRDGFRYCYFALPRLYFKFFFYYFILYFNINNNNNNNLNVF